MFYYTYNIYSFLAIKYSLSTSSDEKDNFNIPCSDSFNVPLSISLLAFKISLNMSESKGISIPLLDILPWI